MPVYCGFEMHIQSEIVLADFPLSKNSPEIFIKRSDIGKEQGTGDSIDFHRHRKGISISYPNLGRVMIGQGNEILVQSFPNDDDELGFYLSNQCVPLWRWLHGSLVFHGSAVAVKNGAIAFIGNKGQGKSTLAGAFYAQGHRVLTDDVIVVSGEEENFQILPSFPQLRLTRDSAGVLRKNTGEEISGLLDKNSYPVATGFSWSPINIQRIYVLECGESLQLIPLSPQEGFLEGIRHSYFSPRLCTSEQTSIQFRGLTRFVNAVRFRKLQIPHSFIELPKILKTIEMDLKTEARNQFH